MAPRFDISPDGKEIWVANAGDGTVSIIDVASKRVTQTLAADVSSANRLKSPRWKVCVDLGSAPSRRDCHRSARRKTTKRIAVGHGAAGIVMQRGGARAYVACTLDDYVAVIDLHSMEVVGHIQAGSNPDGLAWMIRH